MKDTLQFIIMQLVDHPDEVIIEEENNESHSKLIIHVNPEDMGKVIGKQGRIIRSVRDLIKLIAAKHNTYVDVVTAE